ncbi:uncharacterized protein LOC112147737 [Oryzias melastigma]|uniref:uncharacterized protein LOC112147737 n=1 Tax=Oryzias melastigma TaxID=30732 RepID=UPI00168D8CCF|nr:uncharacterized protein LOC112147737 [Oryzias melastigma]
MDGNIPTVTCYTSNASCLLSGLQCGHSYNVSLKVSPDTFNGPQSPSQIVKTAPCPPAIQSSTVFCSNSSSLVSWTPMSEATGYTVKAKSTKGHLVSCNSTTPSCTLTNLTCSETYVATVTAHGYKCDSPPGPSTNITTTPCPPTNVSAVYTCSPNPVAVSWVASGNAKQYTAVALSQQGHKSECTTNQTSCSLPGLQCGEKYSIHVSGANDICSSQESNSVSLLTEPCPPTNVTSQLINGAAQVTWSAGANATSYSVKATSYSHSTTCSSSTSNCTLSDLVCGQDYDIRVSATDGKCTSNYSAPFVQSRVPCSSWNFTTDLKCDTNDLLVSWNASSVQLNYSVTAAPMDGNIPTVTCYTNNASCLLSGLQCGHSYNVSLKVSPDTFNGPQSPSQIVKTAPCPPAIQSSTVFCSNSSSLVSWTPMSEATGYTVKAKSTKGHLVSCNSTTPSCTLTNLTCSETYVATVTAHGYKCDSPPGPSTNITTTPCPPTNVSAVYTCSPNPVAVSWVASGNAKQYTAVALSQQGHKSECTTNQTSCSLPGLQCGEKYSIHVSGANDICSSQESNSVSLLTEPCPPTNVTSQLINGAAQVTWSAGANAASYNVKATSYSHSTTCSSSTSNCTLSDLVCGQDYDIRVSATDGKCASNYSAPFVQSRVPCSSWNFTTDLKCDTNDLLVSWNASSVQLNYSVTAAPMDGNIPTVTCYTNNASCLLSSLQCGHSYNVSLKVSPDTFNGPQSPSQIVKTAPCPPAIQSRTIFCSNSSSLVSWTPMSEATGYTVKAKSTKGHLVSCNSTTPSCTLTNLTCSETYVATVTAHGYKCDSPPGPSTNITTTPCPPAIISRQYNCGTNAVVFSMSDPAEALTFLAQIVGDGYKYSCLTNNASCVFQSLPCGLDLNLTVQTLGSECNSSVSVSEFLQTAPCPPQNVNATVRCSNHSALITWMGSPNALGYNVTAIGLGGQIHNCHTNSSSCEVTDLQCGETYSVKVTAYTQTCTGSQSLSHRFRAGVCPPSNITVLPTCEHRAISWAAAAWAETYIATATAADGHTHTCSSNYSSSCNFTDLHCGETYSVTVVSGDGSCWSDPSPPVQLKAALCPSTNLTAHVSCNTGAVNITWSSVAAPSYVIKVENIGGPAPPVEYTTPNISLSLSNLACGQRYAFSVAVQDGNCQSRFSPPINISTVPCQPSNLTVQVDCGTNNGNFSWAESSGASVYTVEVKGANGHVTSCSSNTTSCSVKLNCGYSYHATLVASTESCDTSKTTEIFFESAPCLPEGVVAKLNCESHIINVNWTRTNGSEVYTAWAISADGHRASCNSTANSCSIHDLLCGKIYDVAVTSSSIKCQVIAGSDYKVQSYPCAPINTTVEQNCTSNSMTVKWHDNSTAQNYTVKAASASGVNSTCESTNSSCSFLDLSCGQLYSFTVMGYSNVCTSDVSPPIKSYTAPCPPTNLSAELNCTTRSAVVTWRTVATAVSTAYNVQATSPDGHNSSCSNMGSSCDLDNLVCGQKYSVVVEAINTGCPGPASAPSFLTTEPCIPINISTRYNMSTAWVMWSAAAGASSYSVQAVTDSGAPVTCGSSNSSCHLNGLQCSRMYNVTVTAHNQACSSLPSETTHLLTEPCQPTNIQASLDCENLSATVSWQQSPLSVGYVAYADNKNGHRTSCFSSNATSCSLSGLVCGNVYSVWVKALGQQYYSSDSSVVSLTSAPCEPGNVKATMDCVAHTATASWQSSSGALSYVAVLTASSGHVKSCTTNQTSCQLSSLQCGEKYNLTVKTLGKTCNRTTLMTGYLVTEPCAPVNLTVLYNVSTAQVMWAGAKDGGSFSVAAVNNKVQTVTCNSTNTHCSLVGLECSQIYNITVMVADPSCNNTVASEPYQLITEPCPPTNVQASLKCEPLSATVSWQQTGFALGYVAYVDSKGGHQTSCVSSNTTSCSISGLMCGTVYSVWVKALGKQHNSSDSSVISLTSGPCQPVIASVQAPCQSDEVQISWNNTDGAVNYLVRTAGNRGYMKTHNTTQSFLSATLPCGQEFNVTVQGQGSVCDSTPSSPAFFKTGPCIPSNVTTQVQCELNRGSVSWRPSDGAETYIAIATGVDSHTHQCLTNTTSCTWTDLHCGEEYTVVVRAKTVNCSSLPSNSSIIYTGPCAPQNLDATVNCGTKVVALNWNSPNGTHSYTVSAKGGDKSVSLQTNTTLALFSDLTCGQNYSLTVTPHSQHCVGNYNTQASVLTWPCTPAGVFVSQACLSNSVMVAWQPSNGTEYYTAAVQTENGVSKVCTTNTSACTVHALTCGQNYSMSVTASNKQCNVTSGQTKSVQSVPCSPTNVSVFMDCSNNSALVSWSASRGAVQYSVNGISSHGNASCQSSGLGCRLSLVCGSLYTVQVVAMDDNCSSIPSTPVEFSSGPCPPSNVSAQMTCQSSNMTVYWDAIRDADHFLVSLTSVNGTIQLCNTTTTTCFISNATCGETFTIQVTSVRGNCLSRPYQTSSIQTAPCQPKGVNGHIDCVSNSAWITWDAALGANNYTVSAVGSGISTTNCTSITDTRCEVKDLACGVSFNFTVTASNTRCDSQPSAPFSLETAPCSLSAITAFTQCHNSSILVMWDLNGSGGTSAYIATAEASDHTYLTCNSTGNSCYLSGAKCDLRYIIIVAASSDRCSSLRSPPYKISMEPCPPQNVSVNASCQTHSAVISWNQSPVAESYQVVATGANGHKHMCNTSSTSCSLTELHCDEQYTVSMTASHENCTSKPSQNATLNTGPCQPSNVAVSYNCSSRSALLTWMPSKNSKEYYGTVQAGSGDKINCHNTNPTCTIDNLECGVSYNFTVQASDGTCNSSYSDHVQFGGAPCPPDGIKVQLLPMEMEVQLLHFSWTHVTCGSIEYLLTLTGTLQGQSNLFEVSSYWTSTDFFEIPLPCSSSYTAMLQSKNAAGTSGKSAPLNGTTAPCPPSGILFSGNSSFATVSWNMSVFATTYTVYDNSVKPRVKLCNTTTLSCSLSNLVSNNLVVTASNAAGESQATSVPNVVLQRRRRDLRTQMSKDGSASAPQLEVTQVTPTAIWLQWSPVKKASHYSLLITKQGSSGSQKLTVYGEIINVPDLSPNSTYCFSVTAVYGSANGPHSDPVCTQTIQVLQ